MSEPIHTTPERRELARAAGAAAKVLEELGHALYALRWAAKDADRPDLVDEVIFQQQVLGRVELERFLKEVAKL